eukprot:TRINITY_DN977_c0_g1_i1.p1 TRINITY_DN977_c0_g1~~TRINITY_DN977_c0_g1_i1.p1  ORF type:complete len:337 (+),score=89.21 TRINITY_DN977_c0_g1_i1:87-1013(+)
MRAAGAALLLACARPALATTSGGNPGDIIADTPMPTPAPTPVPGAGTFSPVQGTVSPVQVSESPLNRLGCADPGAIATVSYADTSPWGTAFASPIVGPTSDWYSGAKLGWPADSSWLTCGTLYRLGSAPLVPRGSKITVSCRAEACDVYVFHYHQPPYSGGSNGNFPQALPGAGFDGKSCSPEFALSSAPNCWYPTMTYRKQLAGAQSSVTVEVDAGVEAMYTGIIVVKGTDCSANERSGSQAACEAPAEPGAAHLCRWQSGVCTSQWCERSGGTSGGSSGGASSGGASTGATSGGSGGSCPPSPLPF